MAKQQATRDSSSSSSSSSELTYSTCFSDLSLSSKPRVMKLELQTLPQFNITYIARCLSVGERLSTMAVICRRFYDFVYQPQCFPDMSFFPVHDGTLYSPKILSSNGICGITYVEINIQSLHPFIRKVALFAGMWNFKADLWNEIEWPSIINIESLQLTLDYTSNISAVYLDQAPKKKMMRRHLLAVKEGEMRDDERSQRTVEVIDSLPELLDGELMDFAQCISPTTKKQMEFKCRLRNLFFIRFDSSGPQPTIYFPKTLYGLGLQTFTTSIFSSNWWTQQIVVEQRFEKLRFLVLSCCDFAHGELQTLLKNTKNVEHLSLRYVRWDGIIDFPQGLLSLGYFPDRHFTGYYSLKYCTRLWQISTRFNENEEKAIEFLNHCSMMDFVKRVKFEFIRKDQYSESIPAFDRLQKWENRENDDEFTVAIAPEELETYPILKEIFPIADDHFLRMEDIKFEDCPLWSEESYDFIHMTNKRKLLLR